MRATSVIACAALTVAGLLATTGTALAQPTVESSTVVSSATTNGPCGYTATPDDPSPRPVSLPPDPTPTPSKGIVKVMVATNQGPMLLSLDRAKAPCTVQSFLHLAKSRFYDFTTCHRLTLYPTLKVLQCGDPTGTGERGPGYSYKDELPTDLPNWPTDPTGTSKVYARGTLAMANGKPGHQRQPVLPGLRRLPSPSRLRRLRQCGPPRPQGPRPRRRHAASSRPLKTRPPWTAPRSAPPTSSSPARWDTSSTENRLYSAARGTGGFS